MLSYTIEKNKSRDHVIVSSGWWSQQAGRAEGGGSGTRSRSAHCTQCRDTPHQINSSVGLASNLLLGRRWVAGTYTQKGSVRMGRLCCGVHSKDSRSGQDLVKGTDPGKICLDAEAQPRAMDARYIIICATTPA